MLRGQRAHAVAIGVYGGPLGFRRGVVRQGGQLDGRLVEAVIGTASWSADREVAYFWPGSARLGPSRTRAIRRPARQEGADEGRPGWSGTGRAAAGVDYR